MTESSLGWPSCPDLKVQHLPQAVGNSYFDIYIYILKIIQMTCK